MSDDIKVCKTGRQELIKAVLSCTYTNFNSASVPSFSLWCRGVIENCRFGADGLFQLWVESVSNNLDSGLIARNTNRVLNPKRQT